MKKRGIKMKNKAFIIAMICLTIICISPIFIGQWLIQRQADSAPTYTPVPECNCLLSKHTDPNGFVYDGKLHTPSLSAADQEKYGNIVTNKNDLGIYVEWQYSTFGTTMFTDTEGKSVNRIDKDKVAQYAGSSSKYGIPYVSSTGLTTTFTNFETLVGEHHYKVFDTATGQVLCQDHIIKIQKAAPKLSTPTSQTGFVGNTLNFTGNVQPVTGTQTIATYTASHIIKAEDYSAFNSDGTIKTNGYIASSKTSNYHLNVTKSNTKRTDIPVQFSYSNDIDTHNYKAATEVRLTASFSVLPTTYVTGYGYFGTITKAIQTTVSGKIYPLLSVDDTYTVTAGKSGDFEHVIDTDCTLASGAELIIAYDMTKLSTNVDNHLETVGGKKAALDNPTDFFTNGITVAANKTFTNNGIIHILGIVDGGGGGKSNACMTSGAHGRIVLGGSSHIKNKGNIHCYGYITESSYNNKSSILHNGGTITVLFTIVEHRGGTAFSRLTSLKSSPFNQFFVQSITTELIATEGASVIAMADFYVRGHQTANIEFFGSSSKSFLQYSTSSTDPEPTVFHLKYDTQKAQNTLKTYGSCSINPISMKIYITVQTAGIYLPLSHHWSADFYPYSNSNAPAEVNSTAQKIKILPGASVTVHQNVTLTAGALAVYHSSSQIPTGGGFVYPDKGEGKLMIDGAMIVDTFGGKVQTGNPLALVSITSSTSAPCTEVAAYTGSSASFNEDLPPVTANGKYKNNLTTELDDTHEFSTGNYYSDDTLYWCDAKQGTLYLYSNNTGNLANETPVTVNAYFSTDEQTLVTPLSSLAKPTYEHHKLLGWYKNLNDENPSGQNLSNGSTLYAKWHYAPQVNITFTWVDKAANNKENTLSTHKIFFEDEFTLPEIANNYCDNSSYKYYLTGWTLTVDGNTYSFVPGDGVNLAQLLGIEITSALEDQTYKIVSTSEQKHELEIIVSKSADAGDGLTNDTPALGYIASDGEGTLSYNDDGSTKTTTLWLRPDGYIAITVGTNIQAWTVDDISYDATEGIFNLTELIGSKTTIRVGIQPTGSSGGGGGGDCLAEGTLITMAGGSKKPVENIRKGDLVMAFDHLTGQITYKEVIIVIKIECNYIRNTFVFDDGTELATINEHGIFDLDLNKYVNIDHLNYEQYLGHRFVSIDSNGNIGVKTLIDVTTVYESGYKYDIVTDGTLNYVAEDTLSVTHVLVDIINTFDFGDNLMYDHDKMMADIAEHGLYTFDDWDEYLTLTVFEQYNVAIMHVGVSKGLYTRDYLFHLLYRYVNDDSLQLVE